MRGLASVRRSLQLQAHARALGPLRGLHLGLVPNTTSSSAKHTQQHYLRNDGGAEHLPLSLPIFQVFGANTDVGKTIMAAGICRAAARTNQRVGYIKPMQTGTDEDCNDASFIRRHIGDSNKNKLDCRTLFTWKTAVSPHLAAEKEGIAVSDDQLMESLSKNLVEMSKSKTPYDLALVEIAGGVCSPSATMQFQADAYRRMRLPAVLVGDGKLGGISTTISAMESLLLRGYDIAAICLMEQDDLKNATAMRPRTDELGIPVFDMKAIPPQPVPLTDWFHEHDVMFDQVAQRLHDFHDQRVKKLQDMKTRAGQMYWWPFTQHKLTGSVSVIDSAHGDDFCTFNQDDQALEPMFDACASWWTQGIGHGNGKMATALAHAAGRYGHVMFPENAHEPSFNLSEKLLSTVGKNWASRVFFSDDGSTAVEVGVKMAFRKYMIDHKLNYDAYAQTEASPVSGPNKLVVLAQSNCYHGDTLGVMNLAEPSVFNERQHPWYRAESVFLKTPSVAIRNGRVTIALDPEISSDLESPEKFDNLDAVFDIHHRDATLQDTYRQYVRRVIKNSNQSKTEIGALLIEPILLGSGGMVLVDPLFQRIAVEECRAHKIPVVFDEVFSGWWRLGVQSGRDLLDVKPDIACYAKLLTGGVVPMAVTLASEDIFQSFYADTKGEALLHGHSFTAYPVGCAAALTAIDMLEIAADGRDASTKTRSFWDTRLVTELSTLPAVSRALTIGTVLCVELESADSGYASMEAQALIRSLRSKHVYARALGNVVYMMCSPLTAPTECTRLLTVLREQVQATTS